VLYFFFFEFSDLRIIKDVLEIANILNSKWKVKKNKIFLHFFILLRLFFWIKFVFIVMLLQRQEELIYIIAYDVLFGKVIYANLIKKNIILLCVEWYLIFLVVVWCGVLIFRRRFHWLAVMRRSSLHVEKMLCSQL